MPAPLGPTALVVDDEAVLVDEMAEYLAESGIAVITASSCMNALAVFQRQPKGSVSVVVTDLRMPEVNGDVLLQRMLSLIEPENAVEFVIITGHSNRMQLSQDLAQIVFAVLNKPLSLATLEKVVLEAHESALGKRALVRRHVA